MTMHKDNSRPVLPMYDLSEQKLLRGSPSAAAVNVRNTGRADAAVALFREMMEILAERTQPDVLAVGELEPGSLGQATFRRLLGQPELSEPSGEIAELRERLQTLKHVRARKPIRALREALATTAEAVGVKCDEARRGLLEAFGAAPHRIKEIVAAVQHSVRSIRLPEPDGAPLVKFENVVRGVEAITERRAALPRSTVEFAMPQLTQRARSMYVGALEAVARELTSEVLREELRRLGAFLEELLRSSGSFHRNLDALQSAVEAKRKEDLHANNYAESSVFLGVPGPSEIEVFAGLLERVRCDDRRQLAIKFVERLESKLRDIASAEVPAVGETAGLGQLLTKLPAAVIAKAYEELFAESLGEGHSLYEILERFGVDRVAQELWQRAEPLCDLRQRDIPQYNINPSVYTVVRLAVPTGPRDVELRERLAAAFRDLGPCSVLDAGDAERNVVSVIKVALGFPIGIELGNEPMLSHYARCAEIGHNPHLVSVVPGSHVGEPIGSYVALNRDRP